MKLGCVTTSYPRFDGDLAGHFVARHVEELRRNGHSVEVIAAGEADADPDRDADPDPASDSDPDRDADPDPDAEPDPDPASDPDADPDPAHRADRRREGGRADRSDAGFTPRRRLGPSRLHRIPSSLFFRGGAPEALGQLTPRAALSALAASARFALATARRARRWDATVAHWLAPSALAALPARGPLLAIAHGGDVHLLRRAGLLAPALALLLARRARLAFVSDELRRLARAATPAPLRRRFDESSIVQPMGVDLGEFAAAAAHARPPPHPRRYLLVLARLVPIKGVDLAIRAFAQLAAPDLDLVIAGDGPERAALQALAASLPTLLPAGAPRVHFLGAIPTHARAAWLAHAAAVLLPSRRLADGRSEGSPQVALEALAAGSPLLASATGGLADLPPPVRLVEPAAPPAAWAAELAAVLAAPPAPAALRALAVPHDWPRVVARLTEHWRLPAGPHV